MNERERKRGLRPPTIPACQAMVIRGEPQSISSSTQSVAKLLKEAPNVAPDSPEERTSYVCACVRVCAHAHVCEYRGSGMAPLRRQCLDGAIGMHGSSYETNGEGPPRQREQREERHWLDTETTPSFYLLITDYVCS